MLGVKRGGIRDLTCRPRMAFFSFIFNLSRERNGGVEGASRGEGRRGPVGVKRDGRAGMPEV